MEIGEKNESPQQAAPLDGPVFSLEPSCHCGCFPKTAAEVYGWVVVVVVVVDGGMAGAAWSNQHLLDQS